MKLPEIDPRLAASIASVVLALLTIIIPAVVPVGDFPGSSNRQCNCAATN